MLTCRTTRRQKMTVWLVLTHSEVTQTTRHTIHNTEQAHIFCLVGLGARNVSLTLSLSGSLTHSLSISPSLPLNLSPALTLWLSIVLSYSPVTQQHSYTHIDGGMPRPTLKPNLILCVLSISYSLSLSLTHPDHILFRPVVVSNNSIPITTYTVVRPTNTKS